MTDPYVGIDVSMERSSVCVGDAMGRIVRETKVASEPEALVTFPDGLGVAMVTARLHRITRRTHMPPSCWKTSTRRAADMPGAD